MTKINEHIQAEMDAIICKTLTHVQETLDEQGEEQAKELMEMIASGIKNQLIDGDMSVTDANIIYNMFIKEINLAVFKKKH